jgi:arylsulfatase A-like enzyme
MTNTFLRLLVLGSFVMAPLARAATAATGGDAPRWNILFLFADDWGRFAGCYAGLDGRPTLSDVIRTPNIDRIARNGIIFRHAYVNAPICTPCRSSLLSGRYFFNCEQGAITDGAVWDPAIPSFPLLLRDAGYSIGKSYKVWSPGTPRDAPFGGEKYAFEAHGTLAQHFSMRATRLITNGATIVQARQKILDEVRGNFDDFLAARKKGEPWHYFFGPTTTHRSWVKGSGKRFWGIDPDTLQGHMPKFLPDVPEVREDVADYLGESEAYDAYIGVILEELAATGEAGRTLIVISGDHGMPGVTSGKGNLYDHGVSVGLIVQVPGGKPGRIVDDMVSLPDLAPTFMEIAGVTPPPGLYGRSILPILRSEQSGQVDPSRDWVLTGRERHVAIARDGNLPYPSRSLHTRDFVYIRNFTPDRWPMGTAGAITATAAPSPRELEDNTYISYADMDGGPTKAWLVGHRNEPEGKRYYDFSFGQRPAEELYDIRSDPDEMKNLAADPAYAMTKAEMSQRLLKLLTDAQDPRVTGDTHKFDRAPFIGDEFQTRAGIDRKRKGAARGAEP